MSRLVALATAAMTLVVFLPTLWNGFVNWDDGLYVVANNHIRQLDWMTVRWAFGETYLANYIPLASLSHAVDYALWGLNPSGHHLTSVVLHAVSSGLVVILTSRLLNAVSTRDAGAERVSFLTARSIPLAAAVTGILFGLHPAHVESVAWISERKDVLCALFYLLSLIAYSRHAEDAALGRTPAGRWPVVVRYLLSLGLFALALLSKPMAVTLPVVLLILDCYPYGRIRRGRAASWTIAEKIPFAALSVGAAAITILAQGKGDAISTLQAVPVERRALVGARALVAYLGDMLAPIRLGPMYTFPTSAPLFSFEYGGAVLLVAGITAASLFAARRQPVWLAAWTYYVATLVPVLGIVQVGTQAMADRYTYLPSLGPFLLAGLGAAWVATREPVTRAPRISGQALALAALAIATLVLGGLSVRQIGFWRDSYVLWSRAIETGHESATAYNNRGAFLEEKGRLADALADYERALALEPANSFARNNRGLARFAAGQLEKALEDFDVAIASNPNSASALRNRGLLYIQARRLNQAAEDLARACALGDGFACLTSQRLGMRR